MSNAGRKEQRDKCTYHIFFKVMITLTLRLTERQYLLVNVF